MIALRRMLPYPAIYVRAVALDMVESVSHDATVCKNHWKLIGTVTIYGNESRVSMQIEETDECHATVCIQMLKPSPKLSTNGQNRVLTFLADGMEQLLENTFTQMHEKKRV